MGLPLPASYSLSDLASLTGIPERTIRSYIGRGLLPPPDGRGRAASYGPEHLERLQFFQRVRAAVPYEVPLAMLEKLLNDLPSEQITRIARGEEGVMAVPVMQDIDPAFLRRKRVDSESGSETRLNSDAAVRESSAHYRSLGYTDKSDSEDGIPLGEPAAPEQLRRAIARADKLREEAEGRPLFARALLDGATMPQSPAKERAASGHAPELPETWTTLQVTPNLRLSMRGQAPTIAKRLTLLAERLRQWIGQEDSK